MHHQMQQLSRFGLELQRLDAVAHGAPFHGRTPADRIRVAARASPPRSRTGRLVDLFHGIFDVEAYTPSV
jgi:hypothetical protein